MESNNFLGTIAKEYDTFINAIPYQIKSREILAEAVVRFYPKDKAIIILDFGIGSGLLSYYILKNRKAVHIVGVDNDIFMIRKARKNLRPFRQKVQLKHQDGLKYLLTMPNNYFDVFASAYVIHNFSKNQRAKALAGAFRVLKNGGLFLMADKCVSNNTKTRMREYAAQVKLFSNYFDTIKRHDLKNLWRKHYQKDNQSRRKMDYNSLKKILFNIGFTKVRVLFHRNLYRIIVAIKR